MERNTVMREVQAPMSYHIRFSFFEILTTHFTILFGIAMIYLFAFNTDIKNLFKPAVKTAKTG